MCRSHKIEVNPLKRIFTVLLLCLLIFGCLLPPDRVQAAASDSKAGAVTTSWGNLNVRSQASTGSNPVATLRKGSYITLISRSGSWWKVEYAKGQYGYCHADYITVVQGSPAVVATRALDLNVRSGPSTAYARTASLSKGETVLLLSSANGWSRILYHGTKTGYVSAQYLSSVSGGQSYPALSLNVPSYKQTDSRWANTLIGSSGKTISQIGCATTAIAMMESYRSGSTIYPDAMAVRLSYTVSGNVYWPSDYTAVTSSSGYLNAIYSKLKEGKPVLFGAKNSYGSQHWVVITGYTGGSTLTASGFTVHDPGTYSRTNLQQFLNAYPTFYKFFFY